MKKITRPDHDGDTNLTVTTMTYTERGQLDTITDPLGRMTDYVYDALGKKGGQASILTPRRRKWVRTILQIGDAKGVRSIYWATGRSR